MWYQVCCLLDRTTREWKKIKCICRCRWKWGTCIFQNRGRKFQVWWVEAARSSWWVFSEQYFEDLFTEEGMGAWKAIFEGGFNFAASEVRNKFYGTASSVQREEDRSASPSIQEYQNLDGKLKHNSTGEWSGNNWGAIGEWLWSEYERGQREWSWSAYERGQRLAIASKRILWHSVHLTWNSVDSC